MVIAVLVLILAMLVVSDTPGGRALRAFGSRIRQRLPATLGGRLTLGVASVLVAVVLSQMLNSEAIRIVGPMLPELTTWLSLVDLGTVLDVLALALFASLTVRLKGVAEITRRLVAWTARKARRARRIRRRNSRKDVDDDEPWLLLAGRRRVFDRAWA